MRLFRRAQTFERRDFILANRVHWHHARPHNLATQNYCAGAALGHAASELWPAQPNLIAESKEQWCIGVQFQSVQLTIHFEGKLAHGNLSAGSQPRHSKYMHPRALRRAIRTD